MDRLARFRNTGYALAIAGLAIAMSSVIPGVVARGQFPWPLLVGSFVYLHGGFLVLIGSRGPDSRIHLNRLRLIRLGFVPLFFLLMWQIVNG